MPPTDEVAARSVVAVGTGEPVPIDAAHRGVGILHEAVSVQLVRADGAWLLQRRAITKALFAGHWANSCCTHPRTGEDPAAAATRRVTEELGLELTEPLAPAGSFIYRARDPRSGLVEHEHDQVYIGRFDGIPRPDATEIDRVWIGPEGLVAAALGRHPAPWAGHVVALAGRALRVPGGRA